MSWSSGSGNGVWTTFVSRFDGAAWQHLPLPLGAGLPLTGQQLDGARVLRWDAPADASWRPCPARGSVDLGAGPTIWTSSLAVDGGGSPWLAFLRSSAAVGSQMAYVVGMNR